MGGIAHCVIPFARSPCLMLDSESVQCPFCGQPSELEIDTSIASQRFTTDCEVCCRPFEVVAECEAGTILSLDVLGS
jgi:transposase-like protein